MKLKVLPLVLINLLYCASFAEEVCPSSCGKKQAIILKIAAKPSGWRESTSLRVTLESRAASIRAQHAYGSYSKKSYPGIKDVEEVSKVVNSREEFRNTLVSIAKNCQEIIGLATMGHGYTGYIHYEGGGINTSAVDSTFDGLSCLFADKAIVRLGGCNIANGCQGKAFLKMIGEKIFQGKEGQISAAPSLEGGAFFLPAFPLNSNFSTQRMKFTADGKNRHIPEIECSKQIKDKIIELRRLKRATSSYMEKRCPVEYKSLARGVERAIKELEQAEIYSRKLDNPNLSISTREVYQFSISDFYYDGINKIIKNTTCLHNIFPDSTDEAVTQ